MTEKLRDKYIKRRNFGDSWSLQCHSVIQNIKMREDFSAWKDKQQLALNGLSDSGRLRFHNDM